MDKAALRRLLRHQGGVISRAQVLAAGGSDSDIARMMRHRDLTRLYPGVYVDHTGPLNWLQRAWGAVLLTQPSALGGVSALRAHGLRGHDGSRVIEVAVRRDRHLAVPKDIRLVRMAAFDHAAQMHLSPPRLCLEVALIHVAGRAETDDAAVAVLADACQERRTTPARLLDELEGMAKARRRNMLVEILGDVDAGACSALERRYLRDVERAHGLPQAERQRPDRGTVRDVEYVDRATLVELDGRVGHEWTLDRWHDLDRDVDAAVDGLLTVRIGWRQVLSPCRLAERVGWILMARGWPGRPRSCGPTCSVRG